MWGTCRYIPCCSAPGFHTPPQRCELFHWTPLWLSVCSASPREDGKKTVTPASATVTQETADVRGGDAAPGTSGWTSRTGGHTLCSSLCTDPVTSSAAVPRHQCRSPWQPVVMAAYIYVATSGSEVSLWHQLFPQGFAEVKLRCLVWHLPLWAHLSVSRYGVQQPCVQFGVVLGQRPVLVILDEVHHGGEGQRLREANPPSFVEDLYQSVGTVFPASVETEPTRSCKWTPESRCWY